VLTQRSTLDPQVLFHVVCGIVAQHSPGEFMFVDLDGLNDEVTLSTDEPGCSTDFRRNIVERDKYCVITREVTVDCDAAHLIPSCKGNEVTFVGHLCGLSLTVYPSTFRKL
jgi:hypothetical protein